MMKRMCGSVLSLIVLAVTASPLLAQDAGGPPPTDPWWRSPFVPPEWGYLPIREAVAYEVGGLVQFPAAYLVKEGVKAALTGDVEVMTQAIRQMGTGSFWASLGVFTVASGATDYVLRTFPFTYPGALKEFTGTTFQLMAGMMAIQVLRGEASVTSVATAMSAYLGAGVVVGGVADAFLYPLLFRATPAGWATAAWRIGTLAATLYAGEKFEEYLNRLFNRRTQLTGTPASTSRRGVADQVEQVVSD